MPLIPAKLKQHEHKLLQSGFSSNNTWHERNFMHFWSWCKSSLNKSKTMHPDILEATDRIHYSVARKVYKLHMDGKS